VRRASPWIILVSVTVPLGIYGRASWSWLVGPVTALALWSLDRHARRPARPAPARRRAKPAPVD